MNDAMISVRDLRVDYGPIRALRGLSFDIGVGETVSIIGANGAGKTTLMRALSGLLPIADGQASFLGQDIRASRPHRLARMGMLHVPEGRGTLQSMPVDENLRLAWEIRPSKRDFQEALTEVYQRFPRLHERRQQLAGHLSGGEQQMLAVARALINRPKLLLIDEPSMGLSPLFTTEVFRALRELRDAGVTILLVEQNVGRALELAHRAMVLTHGAFTLTGTARELANDPRVLESYLGQGPSIS